MSINKVILRGILKGFRRTDLTRIRLLGIIICRHVLGLEFIGRLDLLQGKDIIWIWINLRQDARRVRRIGSPQPRIIRRTISRSLIRDGSVLTDNLSNNGDFSEIKQTGRYEVYVTSDLNADKYSSGLDIFMFKNPQIIHVKYDKYTISKRERETRAFLYIHSMN